MAIETGEEKDRHPIVIPARAGTQRNKGAATISLIAVVVAEMLAGRDGLGFMLIRKAFATRIPEVYALMFVCAFNGVVLNALINLLRWRITGWHMRMTERTP